MGAYSYCHGRVRGVGRVAYPLGYQEALPEKQIQMRIILNQKVSV